MDRQPQETSAPAVPETGARGAADGRARGLVDWNDVRFLLAIVDGGSQAAAAKTLGIYQSTVSRRLAELERDLGAVLFERSGRNLRLTAAGIRLVEQARIMLAAANAINRSIDDPTADLTGRVRISATEGIGARWLTPRLADFNRKHPGVTVEISAGSAVADVAGGAVDVAIRLSEGPADGSMTARRVGTLSFALYASQAYIARHGMPSGWEDLRNHRLCDGAFYRRFAAWQAVLDDHPAVVYRTDGAALAYFAITSGVGIGLLPTYNRFANADLVELRMTVEETMPMWLLASARSLRRPEVRAAHDHVLDAFERDQSGWFPDA